MNFRELFFNKKVEFFTLEEVARIAKCEIAKSVDLNMKVYDIATLHDASRDDLSFLTSKKYFHEFLNSNAGFCIISQDMYEKCQHNAFVGKNVKIGDNCVIGPGACIRDNSIIGNNCQINANAVVSFAVIGDGCIIHNGAKIGQDGFGFAHNNGVNHKVLQIGGVEIGYDVEIGANTCIDRGAINNTKIGNGTKIDNMVQIAHNVEIGQGCFVAGCAAIAGSTKIGNYVQIGGNAGITGHITIGDQAQVSGMSGVTKSIDKGSIVGGYPAKPIREFLRIDVMLSKMIGKKS